MSDETSQQVRVLLWGVPRSVSTAFLKCMTFVEDSCCWYEPYLFNYYFGTDGTVTLLTNTLSSQMKDEMIPPPADSSKFSDNVYDASQHNLSWVRERLEEEYPGKKLIFVKDIIQGIYGHYDSIPSGYRHTFLIRHPLKVFASLKKLWQLRKFSGRERKLQEMAPLMPSGFFFKEMYDFVEHVKTELEPEPIIIDADDFLSDTPRMLKAYCDALGIPFSDALLTWPAGPEVMLTKWIIGVRRDGVPHASTFESTGFGKPSPMPNKDELPEDVVEIAELSMQYYNKLYEQRLKC